MATVTSLHIYPVKALQAINLDTAYTNEFGFAYDRAWMLVDKDGVCVTQRDIPKLATLGTRLEENKVVITSGTKSISLDAEDVQGGVIACKLWSTEFMAREYQPAVSKWFSEIFDQNLRLVQPSEETYRTAKDHPGTMVNFQDAQQILVISEASLGDLNERLDEPVPMSRFRPNVVVDGFEAYEEDKVSGLQIGDMKLEAVGPCGRCTVTTIDQQTGVKGHEPLKTLSSYRSQDNKVLFGQYFRIVENGSGTIELGSETLKF